MSVWLWLLVGFGAAGVLFLLALTVPIDLRFRFANRERTESTVRVEWLFGLLGKNITGGRKEPRAPPPERKKRPKKKRKGPGLRAVWRSGLIQRGFRVMWRLRRAVSVREFRVHAAVNAGDPAETGMTFALLGPVCGVLAAVPGTDIDVVPDFGDDVGVRGELEGWVRVVPILVLLPFVLFALSPATWRGIWRLRKASRP